MIFGGIYHWYPKITGRMLNDTIGKLHFWITFLGTYAIYFPMHYLGFVGVPRRYYDNLGESTFYPDSAAMLNQGISIAAFLVGAAQLLFVYNLVVSYWRGREAGDNPWGATTLEWRTPQTPPIHGNWDDKLPTVAPLGIRLQRAGRRAGLHSPGCARARRSALVGATDRTLEEA